MSEELIPQEQQTTAEEKSQWDKERQRLDQAEATLKRISQEKMQIESKLPEYESKIAELQSKLDAFVSAKEVDADDLDPDLVDPSVIKTVKKLKDQISFQQKSHDELLQKVSAYEKSEAEKRMIEMQKRRREEVLGPLDEQFGAKYRAEAIKLAEEKINSMPMPPKSDIETYRILEQCYRQAKQKDEQKQATPTDTGKGGIPLGESDIKPGSRAEVLAQIKKRGLKLK
ncbi:MAG: hypothetical protein ACOYI9_13675 [Candidatus Hydrogenedentales bacterium]|jgi:hypothetical protein